MERVCWRCGVTGRPPSLRRPGSAGSPEHAQHITCRGGRGRRRGDLGGGGELSVAAEGRLLELETENAALKREIEALRVAVARAEEKVVPPPPPELLSRQSSRRYTAEKRRRHMLRDSIMHCVEEDETGGGLDGTRSTIRISKERISRQASIGTARELSSRPTAGASSWGPEATRPRVGPVHAYTPMVKPARKRSVEASSSSRTVGSETSSASCARNSGGSLLAPSAAAASILRAGYYIILKLLGGA